MNQVNSIPEPGVEAGPGQIFPENWRYLPLRKSDDGWIPAVSYRNSPAFKAMAEKYGRFSGYTADGQVAFTDDRGDVTFATGSGTMDQGVAEWSSRDDRAVGIWPLDSDPQLVIVDCDHDVHVAEPDRNSKSVSFSDVYRRVYGVDQLKTLCERYSEGEQVSAPVIDGGHDRHYYFIFKQNPLLPISRRLIRPRGLSLDIIGSGYQTHWSAAPKSLLRGAELLKDPPVLPLWLTRFVVKPVATQTFKPAVNAPHYLSEPLAAEGTWIRMYQDALITPLDEVSKDGPRWNERCYHAAWMLARAGMDLDWLIREVSTRAKPYNDQEARKLAATIESAYRKAQEGR